MLVLLYCEKLCVCELCGILNVSQPAISKNLSKLRDLGLVDDERQEKYVFYSLRRDNVVLADILENILKSTVDYPQIAEDISSLSQKEVYLSQCAVKDE